MNYSLFVLSLRNFSVLCLSCMQSKWQLDVNVMYGEDVIAGMASPAKGRCVLRFSVMGWPD